MAPPNRALRGARIALQQARAAGAIDSTYALVYKVRKSAYGSDCHRVVISVGDVLADFGREPILIAYATSAGLPINDGMARLAVPGDKKGGRDVSNIARIEVHGVRPLQVEPQPTNRWWRAE